MAQWQAKGPGWEKVFADMVAKQYGQPTSPQTQAPTGEAPRVQQTASGENYAFIRREMPNFEKLKGKGWTPLFAIDDPRLDEQIKRARSAGIDFGLWGDPGMAGGKEPEEFAKYMAQLYKKYGPKVLVPDLEQDYKGYQNSVGWNRNAQLAQAWEKWLPGVNTALTVMGNQRDFNYEAWKNIAKKWLPQAYGAQPMTDIYDPNMIRQVLIDRGVNPALIAPVLGPGHGSWWNTYGLPRTLWTYDDFMIQGMP